MKRWVILLVSGLPFFLSPDSRGGGVVQLPSLSEAISKATRENPDVSAAQAKEEGERAAISSQSWIESPRIGLMKENNLSFMEQQMGPMTSWSVMQDLKFPMKLVWMGRAQSARALAARRELAAKKLEIRRKIVTAYYGIFAVQRSLALLEAQRANLLEIAHLAENRHATGATAQQDEMKAHVEQTKIETEIIKMKEEKETSEAQARALLLPSPEQSFSVPELDLPVPRMSRSQAEIPLLARSHSQMILRMEAMLKESEAMKSMAGWEYAPDFSLTFRKAFTAAPSDNYFFGIEMSIPLWFFMKETSMNESASAKLAQSRKSLEWSIRNTDADVRSLLAKVTSHDQLLRIYQTSLIPQATSTLNSSRSSYQAGKSSFLDLLDSERSVYEVRMAYYRTLADYSETLAMLEEMVGESLSTLPMGDVS